MLYRTIAIAILAMAPLTVSAAEAPARAARLYYRPAALRVLQHVGQYRLISQLRTD